MMLCIPRKVTCVSILKNADDKEYETRYGVKDCLYKSLELTINTDDNQSWMEISVLYTFHFRRKCPEVIVRSMRIHEHL